ncbi:PfkB family carbohydrate kinase [Cellulosimicrobium sp. CUA-896]|uniref:PfkB family carbohydrate kinase n=1 Tax=Cellulosimicrobium sp. CUA-896 TaxID=1517881 RepID=UPI00095F2094|nr:PfkB family carbohydrate kinase [Cellulosimicrobium sp. CUA-896]OLT54471.1 hypothetical protein BJF88_09045 [Cellulosimicrobium sp. CUA-896]
MTTFLVVGEALVDIVETADGTRSRHPGGSPSNVALTAARLGDRAELLTWIGDDELGRSVHAHLAGSDVIVLPQSTGADRTPTALARLDAAGGATYEFDLDWQLAPVAVGADVTVVHTGSIAAVAPTDPPGALPALLVAARETATITYDPNVRPTIMGSPTAVRDDVERLVAVADVVKVSDEDLAWLYPDREPVEVLGSWVAEHGLALGVMTRGGQGSLAALPDGTRVEVRAPAVTVADTVGAGDSFMGALLHALDERGLTGASGRERLSRLTSEDAAAILAFAARVAAITVSRAGADPPRRADLVPEPGEAHA